MQECFTDRKVGQNNTQGKSLDAQIAQSPSQRSREAKPSKSGKSRKNRESPKKDKKGQKKKDKSRSGTPPRLKPPPFGGLLSDLNPYCTIARFEIAGSEPAQ